MLYAYTHTLTHYTHTISLGLIKPCCQYIAAASQVPRYPPPPLQTQHYVYLHNALLTTSQHIPHHLTMHPSPPHNASLTTSQCTVHMHLPTQSIAKHTMYLKRHLIDHWKKNAARAF